MKQISPLSIAYLSSPPFSYYFCIHCNRYSRILLEKALYKLLNVKCTTCGTICHSELAPVVDCQTSMHSATVDVWRF